MHGSLGNVDVDGRDGAVEGEGDLRQREDGDKGTQYHGRERSIHIRNGKQQTCCLFEGRQDEKLRKRERKDRKKMLSNIRYVAGSLSLLWAYNRPILETTLVMELLGV